MALQNRGLALADLVRMDAVFCGDLGQGFVFAQHLPDDLRLECGGVMFSGCHRMGLSAHLILDHFAV